jgi:2-oxoglutarate dehydrogenase E1 component
MFDNGQGFDWATAEAIAFGSLLTEGYPVRLPDRIRTRGTFSQRHSAFVDQQTEDRHYPLNAIREGQAKYEVIDSMLSEYAVLGFEYGYSLAEPNALVRCGRRSSATSPTARRSCSTSSSPRANASGCGCRAS